MGLLQDIIDEASGSAGDVATLLRKTLVLAKRLKNQELETWVQYELNGYPNEELVPEYRCHYVQSYGFYADPDRGRATLAIPLSVLPKEFRKRLATVVLQNPIYALEDILRRARANKTNIDFPWPPSALGYAAKVSHWECFKAWRTLDPSYVAGSIDTVKTRILSMALAIEAEDKDAGSLPSTGSNISGVRVSQIINTNIYGGNVQNLAAGGTTVSQTAQITIQAGDRAALLKELGAVGIDAEDLKRLEEALDADERSVNKGGLGERAGAWLQQLKEKAASAAGAVSTEVVGGVVTQLLLAYFGNA